MKIKSYYAETMDQALQAASKELGDEALILNTRETPSEFRHFGRYEVVCACANPPQAETTAAPLQSSTVASTVASTMASTVAPTLPLALAPSPAAAHRPRRVVVLAGPSGAGKTTCCAKIAIGAKCAGSASPALLTWDSGRVGGSDLLRALADIAEIPLREIDGAEDFASAMADLRGHDLLVIDTPAIGADDEMAAKIVKAHATVAPLGDLLETHLVLSGTDSAAYLQKCLDRYSVFGPAFLLPTHLDEASLDLAAPGLERLGRLQIEWCSTGRSVPEDLQAAEQVLADAAALEVPAKPIPNPPPSPAAILAPAETIEQLLSRFRRDEIPPSAHLIQTSTWHAA